MIGSYQVEYQHLEGFRSRLIIDYISFYRGLKKLIGLIGSDFEVLFYLAYPCVAGFHLAPLSFANWEPSQHRKVSLRTAPTAFKLAPLVYTCATQFCPIIIGFPYLIGSFDQNPIDPIIPISFLPRSVSRIDQLRHTRLMAKGS